MNRRTCGVVEDDGFIVGFQVALVGQRGIDSAHKVLLGIHRDLSNHNWVRAGRTVCVDGGGRWSAGYGDDFCRRKAMAKDWSLVNTERHVVTALGGMCPSPVIGKPSRMRRTRSLVDERSFDRPGNWMLFK
jgi:hypothetical protein